MQPALDGGGPGGLTALSRAVQVRDLPCVKHLIDAGANPAQRDDDGRNALHYALLPRRWREEEKAKEGVEDGEGESIPQAPAVDKCSAAAGTPRSESPGASKPGQEGDDGGEAAARLLLLVSCSHRLDAQDRWGQTPLHLACGSWREGTGKCRPGLARAMLEQHAFRATVVDSGGRLALHCALRRVHREPPESRGVLFSDGEACAEVLAAAMPDGEQGAHALEATDKDGWGCLMLAVLLGMRSVVEVLCRRFGMVEGSRWPQVREPGGQGLTPLLAALLHGSDPLTQQERGEADAMARALLGCSECDMRPARAAPQILPLQVATSRRYPKAVRRILAKGKLPEFCGSGHTALTAMCRPAPYDTPQQGLGLTPEKEAEAREEITRCLLDLSAININAGPELGALQFVCREGYSEVLRLLLNSTRLDWKWESGAHPIVLLLDSPLGILDKQSCYNPLHSRCASDFDLPAIPQMVVRACVVAGLYEPLEDLLREYPEVTTELLMPEGVTFLQEALWSPKIVERAGPRRQGVCEELLRTAVDVSAAGGGEAGYGTALQGAVQRQMWRLLPNICREGRGVVAHLTTEAEPNPPLMMVVREYCDPEDICSAVEALLSTHTALKGQGAEEPEEDGRTTVSEDCCRRGLAPALTHLEEAGLLPPTPPPAGGPGLLAHAAVESEVWWAQAEEEKPEKKKKKKKKLEEEEEEEEESG
eukprot:Hpha_TRINITY_DN15640_c2_g1::TRINITY_DN15640_c2_g1_i1::g.97824::m.97824